MVTNETRFKWYFDSWQKRRVKLKIKQKIIYSSKLKRKRPTKEQKLTEVKFLPEKFEFPSTIILYGDKVAIILWDVKPMGFVLRSKKVAISFRNYFELLWKEVKS